MGVKLLESAFMMMVIAILLERSWLVSPAVIGAARHEWGLHIWGTSGIRRDGQGQWGGEACHS